jgi:hypothetical protein
MINLTNFNKFAILYFGTLFTLFFAHEARAINADLEGRSIKQMYFGLLIASGKYTFPDACKKVNEMYELSRHF